MSYVKLTRLWPVALSREDCARALGGVSIRVIDAAITAGELPCYTALRGLKKPRVLVRDLEKWWATGKRVRS
jgi:hypothetical protein